MPATNAQDRMSFSFTAVYPIDCPRIPVIIFRDKCAIIKDFPLYRIDIGGSLVDTFPESSPYRVRPYNTSSRIILLNRSLDACNQCPKF